MLRQIDRYIWVAEQPLKYFGLSVGTRMTVVRLNNGDLAVISPISIDDEIASQLDRIGNVRQIIAPNCYHYMFAANFKARYPDAIFWAAPGLAEKQPDLKIDRQISVEGRQLGDDLEYVFFDGFQTLGFTGFDPLNECVFFHPQSQTLILTDTALNFDDNFPLTTQLATRVLGGYRQLSPSLLEKIATQDKQKVRAAVAKILDLDFDRVIVAHGNIVETNGKQQFKAGYDRF